MPLAPAHRSSLSVLLLAAVLLCSGFYLAAAAQSSSAIDDWFEQGKKKVQLQNPPLDTAPPQPDGSAAIDPVTLLRIGAHVRSASRITYDDPDTAAATALGEAKRAALREVLHGLFHERVVRSRWPELEQRFLGKPDDFIETAEPRRRQKVEDRIELEVFVSFRSAALLDEVLATGLPLHPAMLPKLVVVLPVKALRGSFPTALPEEANPYERALINRLQTDGFFVYPRKDLLRQLEREERDLLLFGTDQDTTVLLARLGASVFVRGSAEVYAGTPPSYLEARKLAFLENKAVLHSVRVTDSKVLSEQGIETSGMFISAETGVTEALSEAVNDLYPRLRRDLVRSWLLDPGSYQSFRLTVHNLPSRSALLKLLELMPKQVSGVSQVNRLSYQERTAVLEVLYLGKRAEVLAGLESAAGLRITSEDALSVTAEHLEQKP